MEIVRFGVRGMDRVGWQAVASLPSACVKIWEVASSASRASTSSGEVGARYSSSTDVLMLQLCNPTVATVSAPANSSVLGKKTC